MLSRVKINGPSAIRQVRLLYLKKLVKRSVPLYASVVVLGLGPWRVLEDKF